MQANNNLIRDKLFISHIHPKETASHVYKAICGIDVFIVQSIRGKIMQKSITFLKFWDNTIEGYIKRIGSRTYVKFQNLTLKMKVDSSYQGQQCFFYNIFLENFFFI